MLSPLEYYVPLYFQFDKVYVRGSHIRFFIVPDILKNAPMFKTKMGPDSSRGVRGLGTRGRGGLSRGGSRGRGGMRGGRGGFRGRGRD